MRGAFVLALLMVAACGGGWNDSDTTANTVAARAEARTLAICATDDAGDCTPSRVRAFGTLAFCANQRELAVHGVVVDAGVQCQPQ